MLMPEAAMHKNYLLPACKDDIGLARKTLDVKSISKAHRVKKLSNFHFWLRVSGADSPHVLGSAESTNGIGHGRSGI